ncbi:MAG: hypothetical protein JWO40_630 [Candidatus Doudnabacteria bacterium]|nr:hypothetical protein [Candidatus Doudnabacteria bacterium]
MKMGAVPVTGGRNPVEYIYERVEDCLNGRVFRGFARSDKVELVIEKYFTGEPEVKRFLQEIPIRPTLLTPEERVLAERVKARLEPDMPNGIK